MIGRLEQPDLLALRSVGPQWLLVFIPFIFRDQHTGGSQNSLHRAVVAIQIHRGVVGENAVKDPELRRAVTAWAETAGIDEATTASQQRLPLDALYDRVRALLERTMAPSAFL